MQRLLRTDSENKDFVALVKYLDADLAARDSSDHSYYAQFNKIDSLRHVIIMYENEIAIGCGAMKAFSAKSMEIKRMYTLPPNRGQGVATKILAALEIWATELLYESCVLETGKRQPEAIALYKSNGYRIIENYGQYAGVANSVCFEKQLGSEKEFA